MEINLTRGKKDIEMLRAGWKWVSRGILWVGESTLGFNKMWWIWPANIISFSRRTLLYWYSNLWKKRLCSMQGFRNTRSLNFVRWRQIFVGPHYDNWVVSPFWYYPEFTADFQMFPRLTHTHTHTHVCPHLFCPCLKWTVFQNPVYGRY